MASRKTTEKDLENVKAWALVELSGRTEEGRRAFRALPPEVQGELHARAAEERERRVNGPDLT